MTGLLICGAVLWVLGATVVWAICHIGKRGDLENLNSDRFFQDE